MIDSPVVVAALVDSGATGRWAVDRLQADRLAAPHLMPIEVTNVLRRAEIGGDVSPETAALAYADLLDLPVDLYPFEPFAERVWQLRASVTAYDAWYVALAESLETSLATLDERLSTAPGPTCRFETQTSRPWLAP